MKRTSKFLKKAKVFESALGSISGSWAAISFVVAAAAVTAGLASGCSRSAGLADGNLFQIPWPDESGAYHLQKVSIPTYDQPDMLQGRYVHLYVDPYVRDGQLQGAAPVGRYIRSHDGIYIPSDFVSLQAAAVHAHYERLSAMTEAAGVHLDWPVKIGIQANVIDKSGSVHNNAIFDSQLDALLVVPYVDQQVPIAINGGILAHEHFHKIFQTIVLSKIDTAKDPVVGKPGLLTGPCNVTAAIPAKRRQADSTVSTDSGRGVSAPDTNNKDPVVIFNAFFLRAMNEGLADFWGWVYTGDPSFIERSLPSEKMRRLTGTVDRLKSLSELQAKITNGDGELLDEEHLVGRAYEVGSDYARLMVEVTGQVAAQTSASGVPGDLKSFEARLAGAKVLIQALPAIAEGAAIAKTAHGLISPNILLKGLTLALPSQASAKGCGVVSRAAAVELRSPLQGMKCGDLNLTSGNDQVWPGRGVTK